MCHSLMGGKLESDWCARFCWRSTSDQTMWPMFPMVLGRIRQLLTSVCHITAVCQQLWEAHPFFFWLPWDLILGPPCSAAPPHVLLHPHSQLQTSVRIRPVQLKDPDPAVSPLSSCSLPGCQHVSLLPLWTDGKKGPPSSVCSVRFLFLPI